MKTWLITGCSSGLGRALAEAVLRHGDKAVVTARNPATVENLVLGYPQTAVAAALDVTDKDQVEAVLKLAEERFGAIDVLVNNAGYGYRAAVEEAEDADVRQLFATNFFGAVSIIKAVLPQMRARRSGTIINISSIAARRAMPGSGYYAATKFALEGVSDALRRELAPLGIHVLVVEPGPFRTDFAGRSLAESAITIDDYAGTAGLRRKDKDKSDGTQSGDPSRAARTIIGLVEDQAMPFRLLLGSEAVTMVSEELDSQRQEIEDWKSLSFDTDFPEDERVPDAAGKTTGH